MTITITHAPFARSVRVIWLCEELGLPYELQIVENNRKFLLSEDYLKIHPFGKIPAFTDGDVHMFESLAIMQYLLDKHENSLAPKMGEETYPAFLQWFHFGESTLALPITMALGHSRILPEKLRIPAMVTWGEQELQKFFKGLAAPLAQHDYLLPTGFSAADISVAYMFVLAKFAKIFKDAPAPVEAYWERIKAREGWQKATAL